ncbi:MAG: type II and III secretion system protein family protein [Methylobacteriaceae bacterium]|nr:type II and III secretion system protein family protein [Methylobacteriaceae bacterium]
MFFLSCALIAGVGPTPATAQDDTRPASFLRGSSEVRNVDLGEGQSITLRLPRDAREVFVSDPNIVDAVARDMRTIFIASRSQGGDRGGQGATGRATVVVSDSDGYDIMTINVTVGRDLTAMRKTLKQVIPTGEIDFSVNDNAVILHGWVDSASDAAAAQDIAKLFFKGSEWIRGGWQQAEIINALKIRDKDQVMIKVTVAEIQRSVIKQLGIKAEGKWSIGNMTASGGYDFSLGGGSLGIASKNGEFNLDALEQQGVAKTLAEPTLVAISGETATFKAGGQVPILADRSLAGGSYVSTYTYKDVGVSLEFTPMVLSEGRINLQVKTEVNEIDSNTIVGSGGTAFKTREQETTVELPSGASMVTAGLIQQNQRATVQGIPGLMKLPVIGTLFRSRDFQKNETELIIIVTPYIAKAIDPKKIERPTDGFVPASDPQAILLGRLNKVYGVDNPVSAPAPGRPNRNIGYIVD